MLSAGLESSDPPGIELRASPRLLPRYPAGSDTSPGYVETQFASRYHKSEDAAAETYGRYPVLQPGDVASAVCWVLQQPQHVQVHDILMRPTDQPL